MPQFPTRKNPAASGPKPDPARRTFTVGTLQTEVYPTTEAMGRAAAAAVAESLRRVLETKLVARFAIATGNSQFPYIGPLVEEHRLPWDRIECLHLDEYVGISPDHPASFRRWLRERVVDRVHPRAMHYIGGDSPDPQAECARYARVIAAGPIDVASIGIGENGHLAFNDPPVADFDDPEAIKVVQLDQACRLQQVGEGHFPRLAAVPSHAMTMTITTLMRVESLFVIVPDTRKAKAVRDSLEGPVSTACPGSILRRHAAATLFLDPASASLLKSG